MYQQRKDFSFVMCCILILNLILCITPVYAADNSVVLNGPNESANKIFKAENMFPGDIVSQDYILEISHRENIDIMFKAYVQEGYEVLAEVLKMKVTIPATGETLYDGLMKEMPDSLTYTLAANVQTVTYRLSVYLDTTIGNKNEIDTEGKRYQYQTLKADFSWWYMPESTGGGGGGGFNPIRPPEVEPTKMIRYAYVIGRPGEYFRPESPITRAEVATIFARIFADYNEDNLITKDTPFSDVPEDELFAKYISRSAKENIIQGYEGNFRPTEDITRAELAAICVRFFENRSRSSINPKSISFTDFDESHWAYESIRKAYANGYVTGYPDGTLKADNTITRAETVTIVNRMLERIPDKEYIDNNLHKLIDFLDVRDNTYWAYYEIFEAANTHYIRFRDDFAYWVD